MLKGYKTILFNLLAALVPLLELTEMRGVIPDNYLPIYMLAVAMGNLYLRTVTTTPIGKS
jgi:membrane associated rhomboid family serine protease